MIFEMLFKLEMGRKFDKTVGSRLGFLRSGVTEADLKDKGKQPSWKERLASVAMSSENTDGHAFNSEVGTKSLQDVLGRIDDRRPRTSMLVTGVSVERVAPE